MLAADPGRPARLAAGARRAGLIALGLWLAPVAALWAFVGGTHADIALFFSKMAVVTVGGAYAVLANVVQDAVQAYGRLSAEEMLTGLGLTETTPGPLILVLQFVGFLAGFRAPEARSGVPGGILASVLTLWVTFAPCFFFVSLGAPLIERLQENRALAGALAAITAAVVGVVANLAVWFSPQVLFREHQEPIHPDCRQGGCPSPCFQCRFTPPSEDALRRSAQDHASFAWAHADGLALPVRGIQRFRRFRLNAARSSLSGTLSLSRTNAFFLGGGKALVNALYRSAEALGVGVLYDTEMCHLRAEDGFVTEAEVSHRGSPEVLRARAVVAAAGGLQANRDWLRKHRGDAADRAQIRGTPYAQGRVLRCGTRWSGGAAARRRQRAVASHRASTRSVKPGAEPR